MKTRGNARPFSLRIPADLMARIDGCTNKLRAAGLPLNRSDVARLLITRALDAFQCDAAGIFIPKNGEG